MEHDLVELAPLNLPYRPIAQGKQVDGEAAPVALEKVPAMHAWQLAFEDIPVASE